MQVNGKPYPHRAGLTLHDLLAELQVEPRQVAVAVNDDFYPGAQAPDRQLSSGDVIEVVRATAGG